MEKDEILSHVVQLVLALVMCTMTSHIMTPHMNILYHDIATSVLGSTYQDSR